MVRCKSSGLRPLPYACDIGVWEAMDNCGDKQ